MKEQSVKLETDVAAFETQRMRLEHDISKFKKRVKLNVGGMKFETTLTTLVNGGLQSVPSDPLVGSFGSLFSKALPPASFDQDEHCSNSMLAAMFSGRHEVDTDEEGYVFIDRDGTHFGIILNFLRSGRVTLPGNSEARSKHGTDQWNTPRSSKRSAEIDPQLREELHYYQLLVPFMRALKAN